MAIALLYFGLLRIAEVHMVEVDDVKVEKRGLHDIIEVTFKHERKRRNEGFKYYVPSKYAPMFSRYLSELCQDTIDKGKLQFLKNWNKMGKRRVQNTGKNSVNILYHAGCKILGTSSKGYSSHCWRRSAATNLADAGVSLINLKRHRQWQSNRVVEGYIANSLPLRQERLNCLLPAEETEEVGQIICANNENMMTTNESYNNLSNNNLPIAEPGNDLTLYGFSQFNVPEMRVEEQVQVLQPTLANGTNETIQPSITLATYKQREVVLTKVQAIKAVMKQGSTFNNCTFIINNK